MISTPLDQYEADVYELAEHIAQETGLGVLKRENRVTFLKEEKLLRVPGIQ
jgi:hypothetical protein